MQWLAVAPSLLFSSRLVSFSLDAIIPDLFLSVRSLCSCVAIANPFIVLQLLLQHCVQCNSTQHQYTVM